MGSLGLERKKSVTFGAREVLLLDKDSGRREVQSYQIDGMDWKESSDLGDCDVPPPPHPFAPDCGLEEHSVEVNGWLTLPPSAGGVLSAGSPYDVMG